MVETVETTRKVLEQVMFDDALRLRGLIRNSDIEHGIVMSHNLNFMNDANRLDCRSDARS